MNDRQRNRANAFAENARRSLVIVGEVGGPDYCSGFVAAPPKCGCSFIISQSAFVRGRENRLEVRYCCDNMVLPASVIHEGEIFTLLSTDVHDRSVALCLGGAVTQTRKFVFPPSSKENLFQIPAFVTLETVLAYQTPDMVNFSLSDYIEDSGDYFLIRCPYGEKSSDGSCRLVASPVFSMRGGATGVLVGDSRLGGGGSVIKVAMNASLAKGVIYSLFREAEKTGLFKSRKPIFKKKNRGRARKRARMRGGESTAQTVINAQPIRPKPGYLRASATLSPGPTEQRPTMLRLNSTQKTSLIGEDCQCLICCALPSSIFDVGLNLTISPVTHPDPTLPSEEVIIGPEFKSSGRSTWRRSRAKPSDDNGLPRQM